MVHEFVSLPDGHLVLLLKVGVVGPDIRVEVEGEREEGRVVRVGFADKPVCALQMVFELLSGNRIRVFEKDTAEKP